MQHARFNSRFFDALTSRERVAGLTHNFYRYPARFSPEFARAVIETFSEPGDTVLDPFVGGGTTLIEAACLGRSSIGVDLNSLAVFVSTVKTTILNPAQTRRLQLWADRAVSRMRVTSEAPSLARQTAKYLRNVSTKETWRIRKLLQQTLASSRRLRTVEERRFARCVALSIGQWALDCRRELPTTREFRTMFQERAVHMLEGATEYARKLKSVKAAHVTVNCIESSTIGLESTIGDEVLRSKPRLVLTSPPYPGVHVLYHRWQVRGRKETPAPYWIAQTSDGEGASFYNFCDRHQRGLREYFEKVFQAFHSVYQITSDDVHVVQLVAFSRPSWQLPAYLDAMSKAGYEEVSLERWSGTVDGRVWRDVPNRKWYADQKKEIGTAKEVVLIHRKADFHPSGRFA